MATIAQQDQQSFHHVVVICPEPRGCSRSHCRSESLTCCRFSCNGSMARNGLLMKQETFCVANAGTKNMLSYRFPESRVLAMPSGFVFMSITCGVSGCPVKKIRRGLPFLLCVTLVSRSELASGTTCCMTNVVPTHKGWPPPQAPWIPFLGSTGVRLVSDSHPCVWARVRATLPL
jgi:hypothetical protein